jgi:hypothetical protein
VDIKGHKSIFSQDFLQNAEEEKNSTEWILIQNLSE